MSIADEILRLQTAKSDLATSITNKGVTVPANATLDDYAALVDSIQQGGTPVLPYDAKIEYLESTGTQYIDLGFKATDSIYFDIYINRANNNIRFDCGSEEGWSAKIIRLLMQEGNTQVNWRYGNTSTGNNSITNASNCVGNLRIVCDRNVGSIYNLTSGTSYSKTVTGNTPILTPGNFILLGCSIGSEATTNSNISGCRLHSAKVIDRGVNLDLIPVRVGQIGYLYDKVSGQLFGNAGTGNFVLGNDII